LNSCIDGFAGGVGDAVREVPPARSRTGVEHADGGQVLLDAGLGELPQRLLYICGDVNGFYHGQIVQFALSH